VATVGNLAFASQSGQQNVEDIADRGFALDDKNMARPKAVIQRIPPGGIEKNKDCSVKIIPPLGTN